MCKVIELHGISVNHGGRKMAKVQIRPLRQAPVPPYIVKYPLEYNVTQEKRKDLHCPPQVITISESFK